MSDRKCIECGDSMPPGLDNKIKICSDSCRKERNKRHHSNRWKRVRGERSCPICGGVVSEYRKKMCSDACRKEAGKRSLKKWRLKSKKRKQEQSKEQPDASWNLDEITPQPMYDITKTKGMGLFRERKTDESR